MRRAATIAVVLALLLAPGLQTAAAQEGDDEPICDPELELTIDAFRHDGDVVDRAASGENVTVEEGNVDVTVDTDAAFSRLHVENANPYCVQVTVQIATEVVEAATIGTITAADGDAVADWRAVHDMDTEQSYTEIDVRLRQQTDAVFAPSQVRIKTLSWTSSLEASGTIDTVRSMIPGLSSPLEERHHTIEGVAGEQVTVPLTHPDDPSTSIDTWRATYELDDGSTGILDRGTDAPIFYRSLDDGDAIEIVFNEPGSVDLVADPTIRDRLQYELSSYLSSLRDLFSMPISSGPVLAGVVL